MKKSVEILGLPVISITEGRELGMSKTLLMDARNGSVAAITIEDDDWYRGVKLIPYESVIAIGDDAVTITNSENILTLDAAGDYEQLLDENIRIIGTKAITKSGTIQGNITEVFVGDDGKIEKCEVTAPDGTTSEVTNDQISIFGKQVTVIDPSGEKKTEFVASSAWTDDDDTPFDAAAPVAEAEAPAAPASPVIEEPVAAPEPAPVEAPAAEMPAEPSVEEVPAAAEPVADIPAAEAAPMPEVSEVALEETPAPEIAAEAPVETPVEAEAPASEPVEAAAEIPVEAPADEPAPKAESKASAPKHEKKDNKRESAKQAAADKATEERHRRFLLGKKAARTIKMENGIVIVEAGADITEEVLQKAKLANKFIELSMNVQ